MANDQPKRKQSVALRSPRGGLHLHEEALLDCGHVFGHGGQRPPFAARMVTAETSNIFNLAIFVIMALAVVGGITVVNEASRQIRVEYAKRIRGGRIYGGQPTYLPLRVNQAGVIPIIFAISLVLLPSMFGRFLGQVPQPQIAAIAKFFADSFNPGS